MKILHSADWHLCSPLQGRTPEQTQRLRRALLQIPGKVAALCRQEQCDLMLLSGDLFDGPHDADSVRILKDALEEAAVPVFITPGNHDFAAANSLWLTESWPKNVHIFSGEALTAVELPEHDCVVYGAAFTSPERSDEALAGFAASEDGRLHLLCLHGEVNVPDSRYGPITREQIAVSRLDYLALGHIHQYSGL